MPTYVYPKTKEIEEVERKLLPKKTADSPLFKFMPFDSSRRHLIEWEQRDNCRGTQQLRGYNGQPLLVSRLGASRYRAEPGVYGEKIVLDEEELTIRRDRASYTGDRIDLSDLVGEAFEQLLVRRLNLVELVGWNLLIAGVFSVSHKLSGVVYTGSYTPPTFSPLVEWDVPGTSTPLADQRGYKSFGVGQSCNFGAGATQYMNWVTAEAIMANTNDADLGGKLLGGGNTINSLKDVNTILLANDLPPIEIYDGGYEDENGTFQYFIPTGKALVVGRRTSGVALGKYRYTLNVNSPNAAPKPYSRVIDHSKDDIPAAVEVHDGHNGGPLIQFPGSVIVVNAFTP